MGLLVLLTGCGLGRASAQTLGPISAAVGPSNTVRLVIAAPTTNPERLLLQSASTALGPWWSEPSFSKQVVSTGIEFLTPERPYDPARFYRFSLFAPSPVAGQRLPYIRLLSPNAYLRLGQSFTVLGANFATNPTDNTVTFQLPNRSWTSAVTQAATNFLVATVPPDLITTDASTGTLYRVTVRTAQGVGNGVGCGVVQTKSDAFSIRPDTVYIAQPPGSGKQTLVVGGGIPPYHLIPQSAQEMKTAVATLNGPVLEITAATNVTLGEVTVSVQDSNPTFPFQARTSVTVLTVPYKPGFAAQFHTLQAGTAPGATLTAELTEGSDGNFQTEQMVIDLQNIGVELDHLQPGAVAGLLQLFDPGGYLYGYEHLTIREVTAGRASFDVIGFGDGGSAVVAEGEFIQHPATIVINVLNQTPASLVPQPLSLSLLLQDEVLRLPAGVGQPFAMTAHFTSVSTRDDLYSPQQFAVTNTFVTTGLDPGAPRIDRLVPVHGEIYRNVLVRGTNFASNLDDNIVTFAGTSGTRVPGEVVDQTNGELVVAVPPEAISGPVRLTVAGKTSNDFSFFVRFHPDTALLFDGFPANTPIPLRLIHQQPIDDGETAGEVPLQSVTCQLGAGHLAVSNLSSNQTVGAVLGTSFYDGSTSSNLIVYAGQEAAPPNRYVFKEVLPSTSKYVLASLYYSEDANGVTLQLVGGDGLFAFSAGGLYDYRFTTPIYLPPAAPGVSVPVRVDVESQPWTSIPGNEMHVIWNSTERTQ